MLTVLSVLFFLACLWADIVRLLVGPRHPDLLPDAPFMCLTDRLPAACLDSCLSAVRGVHQKKETRDIRQLIQ